MLNVRLTDHVVERACQRLGAMYRLECLDGSPPIETWLRLKVERAIVACRVMQKDVARKSTLTIKYEGVRYVLNIDGPVVRVVTLFRPTVGTRRRNGGKGRRPRACGVCGDIGCGCSE